MFAKPLTLLCVFLLTIANFIILLALLSILVFPLFIFFKSAFLEFGPNLFFFLVAKVSGAIILYILADTIFGFTLRRLSKGCMDFKKAKGVYCHKDILQSFEALKKKFAVSKVKLYLDPNESIVNAYAIGSFSGSAVTITLGLLNVMQYKSRSEEEFLASVRAILGHEMAHLTNRDFFPGLLVVANERVIYKLSRTIRLLFGLAARICRFMPFIGLPIANLIISCYNMLHYILMAFLKLIFMPIYTFLQKAFSRAIEYRCDRESSYAYGGQNMAAALETLGKGNYFSLFSSHPSTNSRIKAVSNIFPKSGIIRPGLINSVSTLISILLIIFVYAYSSQMANIPDMRERYIIKVYNPMKEDLSNYIKDTKKLYNRFNRD